MRTHHRDDRRGPGPADRTTADNSRLARVASCRLLRTYQVRVPLTRKVSSPDPDAGVRVVLGIDGEDTGRPDHHMVDVRALITDRHRVDDVPGRPELANCAATACSPSAPIRQARSSVWTPRIRLSTVRIGAAARSAIARSRAADRGRCGQVLPIDHLVPGGIDAAGPGRAARLGADMPAGDRLGVAQVAGNRCRQQRQVAALGRVQLVASQIEVAEPGTARRSRRTADHGRIASIDSQPSRSLPSPPSIHRRTYRPGLPPN